EPLVVKLTRPDGFPFVDKVVEFEVLRSDGTLDGGTSPDDSQRVQIHTDADGLASVRWRLGSDAGSGNQRVDATSTGVLDHIHFCASGTPEAAERIAIAAGDNQRAEIGTPAMEPLRVWAHDGRNGVGG